MYLTYIEFEYRTKNKLHKELKQFLVEQNRTFLPSETAPERFKTLVLDKIEELNNKHTRCKPIKATFWQPSFENDIRLDGVFVCTFKLLNVKQLAKLQEE